MGRCILGFVVVTAIAVSACASSGRASTRSVPTTHGGRGTSSTIMIGLVPTTVASPPAGLHDLVEGHNNITLDRINLIFVPYGWDDSEDFVDLAATLLSFDTTPIVLEDQDVQFGPFAIEPWRSNRHLFNVWYTLDEPDEPVSYTSMGEPFPISVPDAVVVTLAVDWPYGAASGFTAFIPPDLPDRSAPADPVGITMSVASTDPLWGNPQLLAHELGHAVFGLSDEYVGQTYGFDGREDLSSFPSCAADDDEATAWWGDQIGEVDPMFWIWMDALANAGFGLSPEGASELRSQVAVSLVDGGCYGPTGSIRPTFDSLMNTNIPVFGTVNRRWAEQVLAEYTGQPRVP